MIPDEGVGWMEGGRGTVSVEGTYIYTVEGIEGWAGW